MSLESGMITYLAAHASITAVIGNGDSPETIRLYPLKLPQYATMPAAVYQRISGPQDYNLSGSSGDANARIQITCYGSTYTSAKSLVSAFKTAMSGYHGLMGTITIKHCFLDNEIDGFEPDPDYYGVILDFRIRYVEG